MTPTDPAPFMASDPLRAPHTAALDLGNCTLLGVWGGKGEG